MTNNLQIGDLVYYRNYFCEIKSIIPDQFNGMYDRFTLVRKFRQDGTSLKKTAWQGWTYRSWAKSPDELFTGIITENEKLLRVYETIK